MKYPMLVVDTFDDGLHFKLALNDKFPSVHFYIWKYRGKYAIDSIDDVSEEQYKQIYDYAQKLFGEYYDG